MVQFFIVPIVRTNQTIGNNSSIGIIGGLLHAKLMNYDNKVGKWGNHSFDYSDC